ncbi:type II toxin-antitoxin system PemK/MazF family toxin [Paenibacillus odorifer]|uniref:type II toxin-antitoxin system PemK/MazF family toxin n=1 Tax=Paenibacillus odorifer TaxID=189426 RepID=UPI00096EAAF6|nr:type II toxin-antitoxin system PemK/MazF family toxin [Paenibacillus odorifer]
MNCKRGDVFMADLSLVVGAEQGGSNKPVLVIQNDIGNKFSPTVIVCVLTSKVKKMQITHVHLDAIKNGLDLDSIALLEQIKTIDKQRLIDKVARISNEDMQKVDRALMASCGISI